jgi:hypothetical protein
VEIDPDLEFLLPTFLENRRADIGTIRHALESSDYRAIHRVGHNLRGDSGALGFDGLTAVGECTRACRGAAGRCQDHCRGRLVGELSGAGGHRTARVNRRRRGYRPPVFRRPCERILDAAYDLFSHRGIRAVGIDSIVKQSGVARMTLYRHFASKDALSAEYLARIRVFVASLAREVGVGRGRG